MLEFLGSGILGTLLGGIFRVIPEILKIVDKKNERSHELSMFNAQVDLEKTRGQIKLDEIGAQHQADIDSGVISAFKAAIDQQSEMVKSAGKFLAGLSASVRPFMTYYLLALYGTAKFVMAYLAWVQGHDMAAVAGIIWVPDDMALLCGVINYWIMDRTLAKRGLA